MRRRRNQRSTLDSISSWLGLEIKSEGSGEIDPYFFFIELNYRTETLEKIKYVVERYPFDGKVILTNVGIFCETEHDAIDAANIATEVIESPRSHRILSVREIFTIGVF